MAIIDENGNLDLSEDSSSTSNTSLDQPLNIDVNLDLDVDEGLPDPGITEVCPHCGEVNELQPMLEATDIRGVGEPTCCWQCGFPLYPDDH